MLFNQLLPFEIYLVTWFVAFEYCQHVTREKLLTNERRPPRPPELLPPTSQLGFEASFVANAP